MQKIVSDSGANLGLISFATAQCLDLTIETLEQPFRVQFGAKDARPVVAHYVEGGAIIGRLYVLDGAAMSLSPVVMFTRNGLDVVYSGTKVAVLEDGQEVMCGKMDPKTNLYEFDLADLLNFSRGWVPKHLRVAQRVLAPTPSGHSAPGEGSDDSGAVAALDKWDASYVRQRQAISTEQAMSYCASCFVADAPAAGADCWSCTGGCVVTQPVCNVCMEGVTQDGPYVWQSSSSGVASRILLDQGFEGKGLGKDGQGTATVQPPAAPRDPDNPRHGIGYGRTPWLRVR